MVQGRGESDPQPFAEGGDALCGMVKPVRREAAVGLEASQAT